MLFCPSLQKPNGPPLFYLTGLGFLKNGHLMIPSQRKTKVFINYFPCLLRQPTFNSLLSFWDFNVMITISEQLFIFINSKSIVTERHSSLSRCSVVFMFVDESFNLDFVKGVRYGKNISFSTFIIIYLTLVFSEQCSEIFT